MRALGSALTRLRGLLRQDGRAERAFDEELESHLAMHVEDNLRAGMTPEEARRRAVLKLGGVEATRQAYREQLSVPLLEHLLLDLRFALRQLSRSPVLALTSIGTLALGTAAALAIYAFVDASLIRPLPYPDPERLVDVTESTAQIPRANLSYADYLDWRRMNTVFQSFDIHNGRRYALRTRDGIELVSGVRVSAGFFRTLGVTPVLGRDFESGEDQPGVAATVVLGHAAWQRRFGGQDDIVGQVVVLNDVPHTVIGVLPESFHFPLRGRVELWTAFQATGGCDVRRSCHGLSGVARLKDGIAAETAAAEMRAIAAQLERQYPDSNTGQGAVVTPLVEVVVGDIRAVLLLLLGGAALLLVIASTNVVSLLIVRSESRKRELAVRSTLGASNGRLVRQFVAEGLVLGGTGAALGLWLATAVMQGLLGLVPEYLRTRLPFAESPGLDGRLALAAGLIALGATGLFSLAPALRVRWADLRDGLTEGARGSSGTTWRRVGFRLVVCELAIAMVLLVGAALLGQSLYRLLNVDLGFEPEGLVTLQVAAANRDVSAERAALLGSRVADRLVRLPGVQAVGLVSVLPVSFNGNTDWIRIAGRPYTGGHIEVNMREVSPGYFAAIRARLLGGRAFTDADTATAPRVAVINRTMARMYFPGEDPVGKRFGDKSLTPDSMKQIVGVVEDIREGPLSAEIWPAVYYPFAQSPSSYFAVVARTSSPAAPMLPAFAAAVRELDPDLAAFDADVMAERISGSPAAYLQRSSTWLVGGFASLALLLGLVGLYGVVSYSVGQRTREIGLRLALGAERGAMYRLVLGEAARLAVAGVLLGVLGSVAATGLMRSLLFETGPWDPPTLAGVAIVLAAAALLASYLPARRAARVDPIEALRVE